VTHAGDGLARTLLGTCLACVAGLSRPAPPSRPGTRCSSRRRIGRMGQIFGPGCRRSLGLSEQTGEEIHAARRPAAAARSTGQEMGAARKALRACSTSRTRSGGDPARGNPRSKDLQPPCYAHLRRRFALRAKLTQRVGSRAEPPLRQGHRGRAARPGFGPKQVAGVPAVPSGAGAVLRQGSTVRSRAGRPHV